MHPVFKTYYKKATEIQCGKRREIQINELVLVPNIYTPFSLIG